MEKKNKRVKLGFSFLVLHSAMGPTKNNALSCCVCASNYLNVNIQRRKRRNPKNPKRKRMQTQWGKTSAILKTNIWKMISKNSMLHKKFMLPS